MHYGDIFEYFLRSALGLSPEARLARYCDAMVATMGHADREQPCRWYLKGLVQQGGRKSVEPMAARVQPYRVRPAHQSMHHLVTEAEWSDDALWSAVAKQVLPKLVGEDKAVVWVVDDTGFPKKGRRSVSVAHQYCGQTGKQDNCRVSVTLSIATAEGSLPVGFRLYLPREWSDDAARRRTAGVPEDVAFATKPQLAWRQIEAALQAGYPRGPVLADAADGDETAWRENLAQHGLTYAVGVRPGTTVWWSEHQPASVPRAKAGPGRPQSKRQRDADHQPIAVADLARALPATSWRTVAWRQGVSGRSAVAFCAHARGAGAPRPAARRGMADHRVGTRRRRTRALLIQQPACRHSLAGDGRRGNEPLAHRARLRRTEAETRLGPLRGPKLARLPSPRQLVRGSLRFPDAGAPVRRQKKLRSTQNVCRTRRLPPSRG